MFLLDPLAERFYFRATAFEQRNRFAERPLEMCVADLLAGRTVALSVGRVGAFYQAAVREKFSDAGESINRVDLVEHRHREDFADAGNRLQAKEVLRIVEFCVSFKEQFELANGLVVLRQKVQIHLNGSFCAGVLEAICDADSVRFVADLFSEWFQVALVVDDLNVSQRLGSQSHEVCSSSQQVTCGAKLCWISVGCREVSSSQQQSEFFTIEFVVFDFSAVDGFKVQRMSEHEGDLSLLAFVGEPVPVEGAFASDDDVAAEGFDLFEEFFGLARFEVSVQLFLSVLIDDASVHLIRVEVDSAVEWMLSLI